jgi:hypothetical protein
MIGKVSTFSGPSGLFQGTSATPSLVLSLDVNNVLSYPGTGITWSDLTIFNNDTVFTTVSGNPNPTYSISGGGSFQFGDGDDSFVLSATSNGFPLGDSQYTIETWINPDNLSQLTALVVYGTLGGNSANAIGLSNSSIFVDWIDNNLSSPTQSMIAGNWYYLSSTYNGTDRKIYLNGSLIASDTPGVTNSITTGDTFTIGNSMGMPFTGKISIVKLHTKALSAPKLLSNFNSLKNRFGYTFGSMTFNDTDAYLISTSNDYVLGTNDFTVETFFRAATSSHNYAGIISQRQVGNNNISINLLSADTSEPLIEFSSAGGLSTYTASNDEWYHVAISRTGGTSSYFINGNLVNEVVDTTDYTPSDLVVGRYYTEFSDYYFNGLISNVRVINGTGLYTGTFSIPDVQLSGTESNTKLLIASQEMNPTADLTGLQSVTASNIGWTSSLPSITLYVTENLQFYVDAGLTESYSGTGTTWYDISGNSRNLTMDSLSYSSNNGGYIIFDGSHTADSVATYSINFSNGFTVESVAKFSGSGLEGLFAFNGGGDFMNLQAQNGANVRWEIESGQSFTSTDTLSSNTWYHFTCVYEGDSNNTSGTARIYINGVENNTASLNGNRAGQSQTSNFVLGLWDGYLTGNIALSRMYNKVLTPIEVLQNFDATKSRYGL